MHRYVLHQANVWNSLALATGWLAVEAVKEAASIVALFVTVPIVKVAPALQCSWTVLPRVVEVKWAVAAIPIALIGVASNVAKPVTLFSRTLSYRATGHHFRRRSDVMADAAGEIVVQYVAQQAIKRHWAHTVEVRWLWNGFARASIVAGLGSTVSSFGCMLALRATKAWWAKTQRGFLTWDAGATIVTV